MSLPNLYAEQWHESFTVNCLCPECEKVVRMHYSLTAKSIRLDCGNVNCKKVYFYRRVNLGGAE